MSDEEQSGSKFSSRFSIDGSDTTDDDDDDKKTNTPKIETSGSFLGKTDTIQDEVCVCVYSQDTDDNYKRKEIRKERKYGIPTMNAGNKNKATGITMTCVMRLFDIQERKLWQ